MIKNKIKAIFESLVVQQIDWMIKYSGNGNEWSGIPFYTEEKGEDGYTILRIKSLFIMDFLGNPVHTQFKEDSPDLAEFRCDHTELLSCYSGLLHSHHTMWSCPHSTEDDATMRKESSAKDRTNFLSIIVYNSRELNGKPHPYDIRISQKRNTKTTVKTTISKSEKSWNNQFGKEADVSEKKFDDEVSEKNEEKSEIEIIDILWDDVIIESPSWGDTEQKAQLNKKEFISRCWKIRHISQNENLGNVYGGARLSKVYPRKFDFDNYDNFDDCDNYTKPFNSNIASYYNSKNRKSYESLCDMILTLSQNNEYRYQSVYSYCLRFNSMCDEIFINEKNFNKFGSKVINTTINIFFLQFKNEEKKAGRIAILKAYRELLSNRQFCMAKPYYGLMLNIFAKFLLNNKIILKKDLKALECFI